MPKDTTCITLSPRVRELFQKLSIPEYRWAHETCLACRVSTRPHNPQCWLCATCWEAMVDSFPDLRRCLAQQESRIVWYREALVVTQENNERYRRELTQLRNALSEARRTLNKRKK